MAIKNWTIWKKGLRWVGEEISAQTKTPTDTFAWQNSNDVEIKRSKPEVAMPANHNKTTEHSNGHITDLHTRKKRKPKRANLLMWLNAFFSTMLHKMLVSIRKAFIALQRFIFQGFVDVFKFNSNIPILYYYTQK